jgi:hypothetical protein
MAEARRTDAEARRLDAERVELELEAVRRTIYLVVAVVISAVVLVYFLLEPGRVAAGGVGVVALLGWLAKRAGMT